MFVRHHHAVGQQGRSHRVEHQPAARQQCHGVVRIGGAPLFHACLPLQRCSTAKRRGSAGILAHPFRTASAACPIPGAFQSLSRA
ncbi:hypothetical protein BRM01_06425 [Xanthomonas oryzae pv. oryzae]|nr:hypothetical protein BRM01_06425 [Xanthomonas oryzae pv. oryzae]